MLVVAILQVPLALGTFAGNRNKTFAFELVVAPASIIPFLITFLLAMPLARRLAQEGRGMRFLESLSVGAIAVVFINVFGTIALRLSNTTHTNDEVRWSHDGLVVTSLALADILGLVVAAVGFPIIYRQFWMPTRRRRRR
jgi:hypothetical protein